MGRQEGEYSLAAVTSARCAHEHPGPSVVPAMDSGGDLRSHTVSSGGSPVHVSLTVWIVSLVAVIGILGVALLVIGRRPHVPSMRECALWVGLYVGLAIAFGIGVSVVSGPSYGGEFFAGWLTEYSLSVDNLFVFVIIMARFKVPKPFQQKALLIGIGLALVMRGAFIAVGAAALSKFEWIFYIFGAFLVY